MTEGRRSAPRLRSPAASTFLFGPYRFNPREQVLSNNGNEIELPPRALKVLEHLVRRSGRVVSKGELLGLWGDTTVSEQSLSDAIRLIRRALDDSAEEPRYVQTLYRRGYRFVAELTVQPGTAAEGAGPRLASRISGNIAQVVEAVLRRERAIAWSFVAAMAIVAAVAIGLWRSSSDEPTAQSTVYATMSLPSDLPFEGWLQISRDGSRIAYLTSDGLVVGNLADGSFTLIPDSESIHTYVFSPDGQWVVAGDSTVEGYRVKKVALDGGAQVSLGLAGIPRVWGEAGILYRQGGDRYIVPAEGGSPRRLPHLDGGSGLSLLPDGKTVLLTEGSGARGDWSRAAVVGLAGGELKTVLKSARYARYVPTGHLIFLRDGALWARPFDLSRLEAFGEEVRLMQNAWGNLDVSDTGTLVFPTGTGPLYRSVVAAASRDGSDIQSWPLGESLHCGGPRLSPDGRQLAISCREQAGSRYQIWVGDMGSGAFSARPSSGTSVLPVWTPDGRYITYGSDADGRYTIAMRPSDGSGTPRELLQTDYPIYPQSWSPDGEVLAYMEHHPETGENIRLLPSDDGGMPVDFAVTAALESGAVFSPDGKWIAYHSDDSGEFHTYVQPFPGPGNRTQISTEIGGWPVWSRDGTAIYYVAQQQVMMVVDVSHNSDFSAARPRRLFELPSAAESGQRSHLFDITPAGDFVTVQMTFPEREAETQIRVVLNWFDELKRLVPTDR